MNVKTDLKECTKCNKKYPATDEFFYKQKTHTKKNGVKYTLSSWCKECSRVRSYSFYIKNKESHLAQKREHYDVDEKFRQEKLKKQKVIDRRNKETKKLYMKQWQKENKDKVYKYAKDKRGNKEHDISETELFECLDFFNNSCAYCGITEGEAYERFGQLLHRDHIDPDGANDITNCAPACRGCNTSKHVSELNEWYNKDNPVYSKRRYNKIIKWILSFTKV